MNASDSGETKISPERASSSRSASTSTAPSRQLPGRSKAYVFAWLRYVIIAAINLFDRSVMAAVTALVDLAVRIRTSYAMPVFAFVDKGFLMANSRKTAAIGGQEMIDQELRSPINCAKLLL